ncbi:hypothetical protein HUU05_10080 [candidate division KSB1 bacterium]|nr:hypothetical protein [candidate division KSB1 bacterium]
MTVRFKLETNLHWLLFVGMAATIGLVEIGIVASALFAQNPDMFAFAITCDIALVIPILYYFLAVRRKHVPPITLVPIFILSLVLAGLILPVEQHAYLDLLKLVIPALELLVLSYIVVKIRAIIRSFREVRTDALYFSDALAESCARVLGQLSGLGFILTEFSLLYCAIWGWFNKYKTGKASDAVFCYHRKSGYGAILGAIVMMLVVETLALHLLLQTWSALAAWIFTGLSAYSLLWMIGDYHAMRLHPIILRDDTLSLRTGLRWRVNLPLDQITAIEKFRAREQRGKEYLSMALFGSPRLVLHCKAPVLVHGLFGLKRVVTQIGLSIDEEKLFLERAQARGDDVAK